MGEVVFGGLGKFVKDVALGFSLLSWMQAGLGTISSMPYVESDGCLLGALGDLPAILNSSDNGSSQ